MTNNNTRGFASRREPMPFWGRVIWWLIGAALTVWFAALLIGAFWLFGEVYDVVVRGVARIIQH